MPSSAAIALRARFAVKFHIIAGQPGQPGTVPEATILSRRKKMLNVMAQFSVAA